MKRKTLAAEKMSGRTLRQSALSSACCNFINISLQLQYTGKPIFPSAGSGARQHRGDGWGEANAPVPE